MEDRFDHLLVLPRKPAKENRDVIPLWRCKSALYGFFELAHPCQPGLGAKTCPLGVDAGLNFHFKISLNDLIDDFRHMRLP
jgi:hypothetical protein